MGVRLRTAGLGCARLMEPPDLEGAAGARGVDGCCWLGVFSSSGSSSSSSSSAPNSPAAWDPAAPGPRQWFQALCAAQRADDAGMFLLGRKLLERNVEGRSCWLQGVLVLACCRSSLRHWAVVVAGFQGQAGLLGAAWPAFGRWLSGLACTVCQSPSRATAQWGPAPSNTACKPSFRDFAACNDATVMAGAMSSAGAGAGQALTVVSILAAGLRSPLPWLHS